MSKSCLSNVKFLIERLIKNQRLVLKIKGNAFIKQKFKLFSQQILDSDSDTQIDQKIKAFSSPT